MFRLRLGVLTLVSVDSKIRTIHAAEIATAALVRRDYVRWMIAFGIESGRKRKNLGGTEFHAEPACFATLDNNGYASFSHKNPHNGVLRTPVVQKALWVFLSQDGVTHVTAACEV
jgi:hypothetical protein